MKHGVLYILLFMSLVFVLNTAGRLYVPVKSVALVETAAEAKKATDQAITVCVAANSYADISSQQSVGWGFNLARRYRPAGLSMDKLFFHMTEEKNFALVNSYKNTLLTSREYFARQKLAGYYIYALRKIII